MTEGSSTIGKFRQWSLSTLMFVVAGTALSVAAYRYTSNMVAKYRQQQQLASSLGYSERIVHVLKGPLRLQPGCSTEYLIVAGVSEADCVLSCLVPMPVTEGDVSLPWGPAYLRANDQAGDSAVSRTLYRYPTDQDVAAFDFYARTSMRQHQTHPPRTDYRTDNLGVAPE